MLRVPGISWPTGTRLIGLSGRFLLDSLFVVFAESAAVWVVGSEGGACLGMKMRLLKLGRRSRGGARRSVVVERATYAIEVLERRWLLSAPRFVSSSVNLDVVPQTISFTYDQPVDLADGGQLALDNLTTGEESTAPDGAPGNIGNDFTPSVAGNGTATLTFSFPNYADNHLGLGGILANGWYTAALAAQDVTGVADGSNPTSVASAEFEYVFGD